MSLITVLQGLRNTPIPDLLVMMGILFLLLPFASRIGAVIDLFRERQKWVGATGALFLIFGIGLFMVPKASALPPMPGEITAITHTPTPTATSKPSPTATSTPSPTATPTVVTLTPTPTPTDFPTGYWHGVWESACQDFICGRIKFTHDSTQNTVSGTFADGAETLVGVFQGKRLSGTWSAGGETGSFDFWITPDGTTWYGNWNKMHYWCGYRIGGEPPEPCGVATWYGDWQSYCKSQTLTLSFNQDAESVLGFLYDRNGKTRFKLFATASDWYLNGTWLSVNLNEFPISIPSIPNVYEGFTSPSAPSEGWFYFSLLNEGMQFIGSRNAEELEDPWCGHREGYDFPDPCGPE